VDAQIDAINQAVSSAVDASVRSLWRWQIVVVLPSVIVGYIVAYAKWKGENYARKEVFDELLKQVKETTKTTEEIKADISRGVDSVLPSMVVTIRCENV
jgi:hypothetical protein